jgi:iron complex transport system substrate-binding protein
MKMRRRIANLILLLVLTMSVLPNCWGQTGMRTIVDMAGRKVTVPEKITKVYSTSQIGIIAIYTLNPDQLAGWNFALTSGEKKFIAKKYYDLPVLGSWSGKNTTANLEEIIRIHPDCLISMGTIDQSYIDSADRIQQQLKIPVLLIDGSLTKLDAAYQFLGELLGDQARARDLGSYCRRTVTEVTKAVAKVPSQKRVRVYYAEGLKGLETDPKGSFHTEVLDLAGGVNVADVPLLKGYGRSQVSLEQLLVWNPEVIIAGLDKEANNGGMFGKILTDSGWLNLQAVQAKRVYEIPTYPFDWFDRPPGVNRIIGLRWLAHLLYPEYVKLDLEAAVKEFYSKFYRRRLTGTEVAELLEKAR